MAPRDLRSNMDLLSIFGIILAFVALLVGAILKARA